MMKTLGFIFFIIGISAHPTDTTMVILGIVFWFLGNAEEDEDDRKRRKKG